MGVAAQRVGRLVGKVSVITGVASGIGRATALAFAREGAHVFGGDQDDAGGLETVRLIRDATGETMDFLATDVRSGRDVARLIQAAVDAHGHLDALFNNVGVNLVRMVPDVTEEEWDATIDTNLKSVFLGCKFAIPHFFAIYLEKLE